MAISPVELHDALAESATVEVLFVGTPPPVARALAAAASVCAVTSAASVAHAIELLRRAAAPQLVVVAQDWPGQISVTELAQLHAAAPLAAMCMLLGSWCEGETRSGRPWPGAVRCYWHQWPSRFQQAIAAMAAGRATFWSLPPTSLPEEDTLASGVDSAPRCAGLLAIMGATAETGAALSDAAQARGYQTIHLREPRAACVRGAAAALWDVRPEVAADPRAVREVLDAVCHAPLIALVGFPRPEDCERAQAAGVGAVVSKPLLLRDLFWQVEQLR